MSKTVSNQENKEENNYSFSFNTEKSTIKFDILNNHLITDLENENETTPVHQFIQKKTLRGRKEKITLPKDKLKCEICLKYCDNFCDNLISCAKCKCVFHPKCNNFTPINFFSDENSNPILCDRCDYALSINEPINKFKCFICDESDGVLNYNSLNKNFYHKICLDLLPEFKNVNITEICKENIKKFRYKNSCKYCNKKLHKDKAVIKCKHPKCKEYFHIPCAIEKGMIFDLDFMKNYYKVNSNDEIPFYCSNHNKKIAILYKNYVAQKNQENNFSGNTFDPNEEEKEKIKEDISRKETVSDNYSEDNIFKNDSDYLFNINDDYTDEQIFYKNFDKNSYNEVYSECPYII